MVKIYTVHGTNAGDPNDVGDQWWQLESDFQRKLADRIVEPLEFVPIHWSGANSERERREAGNHLARKIRQEEEAPIVIGHSHGGSVTLHALFGLFLKAPQQAAHYFRSLITVGTPMIRYRGAINPMFRFNIVGQLFLIYAALIGLLVGSSFVLGDAVDIKDLIGTSLLARFFDLGDGFWGLVGELLTPAVLFATVLPIVVLWFFARRSGWRNKLFANNALFGVMRGRYAPLNHAMDEAIVALRSGVGLNLHLVDRKTVRTAIFAPIALSIAAVLFTRTISETVNIEALTADTVIDEAQMDTPVMAIRGENQLALRDATQTLTNVSGDLRRNADATGRIRRGLTRQTVYLRNDYLVLDIGSALNNVSSKDDLVTMLRTLSPTATSNLVAVEPGKCLYFALYMTPQARDELITWAQALPDDTYRQREEGLRVGEEAYLKRALLRGSPTVSDVCPQTPAALMPGAAVVAKLLDNKTILPLADSILVSARGPTEVLIREQSGRKRRAIYREEMLRYPALEHGEAIVFERSAYNDVQATCLLDKALAPAERLTPWEETPSNRSIALNGLCHQVEGGDFTAYDFATTLVGEVQYNLENLMESGVTLVGQFLRFGDFGGGMTVGDYFGNKDIRAGVLSPFYFVVSVIVVSWVFAVFIAFFLAPVLSGVFNGLIRKNIFGNDGYGETVKEVAPGLDFDAVTIGTLPPAVEQDIVDYVQQYAPDTIQRVREIISMTAINIEGGLPMTEISEALTWKELIHTAYFDVDSFVDYVADTLVKTAGLTRRVPSTSA